MDCPAGYNVVYVGQDGAVDDFGKIISARVKRDVLEHEDAGVDPNRRGYPSRRNNKKFKDNKDDTDMSGKAGYYCLKHGAGDGQKTEGEEKSMAYSCVKCNLCPGVGITVNGGQDSSGLPVNTMDCVIMIYLQEARDK